MEHGRPLAALEILRQAHRLKPGGPALHECIGRANLHLGRVEDGIAAYRIAAAAKPGRPLARLMLGLSLMGTGELEEAVGPLEAVPELSPYRPFAELHLGKRIDLERLISKTYTLDGINEAFEDMLSGRCARGVIVFE